MTRDEPELHRFSFPTAITFGAGARQLLVDHLRAHDVGRPLVVTDQGVGALADVRRPGRQPGRRRARARALRRRVGQPDEVPGRRPAWPRTSAHGADGIVGIGGGAALDVAKAIALMATHPGDLFEYEDEMPGARPIGPVPHFVAVPTTAGTGSEVGRSAVISDDVTHVKRSSSRPTSWPTPCSPTPS